MRNRLFFVALTTLAACAMTRDSLPPDLVPEYDELVAAEKAAAETPDPADDAAVAERFASLEAKVDERRVAPLNMLYPGLGGSVAALLPLFRKRGRKHYLAALKNVTPGLPSSDGSRGVSPVLAAQEVARAFASLLRPSDASERVA